MFFSAVADAAGMNMVLAEIVAAPPHRCSPERKLSHHRSLPRPHHRLHPRTMWFLPLPLPPLRRCRRRLSPFSDVQGLEILPDQGGASSYGMRAYDDAFSVAIADVVLLIVLASASEPSLTAVAEPTRSWRYDDDGIRGGGEGGRVQSRNLGGGIYTLDILSPFSP